MIEECAKSYFKNDYSKYLPFVFCAEAAFESGKQAKDVLSRYVRKGKIRVAQCLVNVVAANKSCLVTLGMVASVPPAICEFAHCNCSGS